MEFSNDLLIEAFVSFDDNVSIGMDDFVEFKSGYAANGKQYMVGKVSLEKLQHWSRVDGVGVILAADPIGNAEKNVNPSLSRSVA